MIRNKCHHFFFIPGGFWPLWPAGHLWAPSAPWLRALPAQRAPTPATGKLWTGWSAGGRTTAGGWSWSHRWSAVRPLTSGSLFHPLLTLYEHHLRPPKPGDSNAEYRRGCERKHMVKRRQFSGTFKKNEMNLINTNETQSFLTVIYYATCTLAKIHTHIYMYKQDPLDMYFWRAIWVTGLEHTEKHPKQLGVWCLILGTPWVWTDISEATSPIFCSSVANVRLEPASLVHKSRPYGLATLAPRE